MKKLLLISTLWTLSHSGYAGLQTMDDASLQMAQAQGGADLSLVLSLNHGTNIDGTSTNTLSSLCTTAVTAHLCRLAIAPNNRYDNGDYIDRSGAAFNAAGGSIASPTGNKLWLVFKGIQGTINIQKIGLDGEDLNYVGTGTLGTVVKPTIQLSYTPTLPILIRNFGYQSLSIEKDNTIASTPGYWLNTGYNGGSGLTKYTNGRYDYSTSPPSGYSATSFDHGREIGFTGLNMNGNLALAGTVKVFGCDSSHPRC